VFTVFAEGDTRPVDFDEVRKAVPILFAPGDRHEIRALPSGKCRIVSSDDVEAVVKAVSELDGTIYYSLNPISPTAERANSGSVVRRRWLLVDIDPIRGADVGSTDDEKAMASQVVDAILGGLGGEGWPEPVVGDSGNGWHLHYRIDLPNDKLSRQLVKAVLSALAARYDTQHARVDVSVHDAPRICKLPGTWSRKGKDTADRPHRRARIMFSPDKIDVVPVELLASLGDAPKASPSKPSPTSNAGPVPSIDADPFVAIAGATSLANYVKAAVTKECVAVSLEPEGNRNNRLNVAAFNLGTLADWPEMDGNAACEQLRIAALQAGMPERDSWDTIARAWTAGKASPRDRKEDKAVKAVAEATAKAEALAGRRPVKYASEITPKKIEFLWPGRIPLGKLTTFAGHGGLGKTFVLCDISARISTGAEWPFSGGECAEPGDVLFISGEDDEADTLVPRLMECGADRSRVAFLSDEFNDAFSLVKLDVMAAAVKALRNPRLVVIDPPTNYLEGVDDHKNSELRSLVLKPLARFASDHNVAIILNNHVNKSSGKDVDAACRVMGSVAWVNGVRTAYLFVRNESDPEQVVIATIKTNVGKLPSAITYKVVSSGEMAKVEWVGEQERTADQLNKATTAGAKAATWLEDMFRAQREWPSADLLRLAKDAGISKRSLFESAEVSALPILKRKRTSSQGETNWFWLAEAGWPPERESWESWESCSATPDAATDMKDSRGDSAGGNLAGDGNLAEGESKIPVRPTWEEDSHSPGTQREPSISHGGHGVRDQDSHDSQDSQGVRTPLVDRFLKNL
jgi:hypothetical protein